MAANYQIRPITAEQYHRMGEAGIIEPDERVELLDGELIAMPPIGPDHGFSVMALTENLTEMFRGRAVVMIQSSFALDAHSEPEPDVALLIPPLGLYRGCLPSPADILLVIEVSNSSWGYDRTRKYRAYARADISEFWIVHLAERRVYQFRDPDGDRYLHERTFTISEHIAPKAFPDDPIAVLDILP
jgi:Uma2 family endonuclease